MYLKHFYLGCLSHASYLIGSEGEAAVVDPQRDVEEYLEEARRQGLAIRHVLETHFHADFVSGHRELATRTGATIYFGARARAGYPVTHLADGDEVRVGKVILRTLETPGHTPESVCYLVIDAEQGPEPVAVLTGDTLFVGEVGRPDLMGIDMPASDMAEMLYDSLHGKLMTLPDDVVVYPAHGPGSACGRNIGQETSSTIGRERKLNYALNLSDRASFVRAVSEDLPAPPRYFPHDARLNREGPGSLDDALAGLRPLAPAEAARMADVGEAVILDARSAAEFGAGHPAGALNVGLDGRYASWAGTVIDPGTPLILVTAPGTEREAAMRLARVGYDNARGYVDGGAEAWEAAGLPVGRVGQVEVTELERRLAAGDLEVLDVRGPGEWEAGHIVGARHRSLPELADASDAELLPGKKPVAVICGSGYRSSIACSLLGRLGASRKLLNVAGGMDAWQQAGLPVEKPAA